VVVEAGLVQIFRAGLLPVTHAQPVHPGATETPTKLDVVKGRNTTRVLHLAVLFLEVLP
jgi:hypothetical protein